MTRVNNNLLLYIKILAPFTLVIKPASIFSFTDSTGYSKQLFPVSIEALKGVCRTVIDSSKLSKILIKGESQHNPTYETILYFFE